MSYHSNRYWLTFNGEIYNHGELRELLVGRGHTFLGTSDTEVVLASYAEWGLGFLSRMRGMFALVLVDVSAGRAVAARDRFGIKPLYYAQKGTMLTFGSEIKQLLSIVGPTQANGPRLFDFLNSGLLDHTADTLHQGVRQIRPGHLMAWDLGREHAADQHPWYALPSENFRGSFTDAAVAFRE